jgi:hypothetical protein
MVYVILALAALFLFTLGFFCIGKITAPKGTGILGIIAGITGSIIVLWIGFTDALGVFGTSVSVAVAIAAFCFTVLWTLAGFEVVLGGDFKATGYFSLLGGFFAFFIGLGWFGWNTPGALPTIPQFGIMFEVWAVAFWTVFAVFALGKMGLMKFLGWWLIIPTVLITCVWPALAFANFGALGTWLP